MKESNLVETLLYFASGKGRKPVPFDWLTLTVVIAKALEEYLTGENLNLFDNYRQRESFAPAWFQDSFNPWLGNLLDSHGSKLNPNLRDLFQKTLTIQWVPKDGPSDGYSTNGVGQWRHWMIQMAHFSDLHGNFTWSVPEVESAAEFIERELGEEARHHCKGIADLMKSYIEREMSRR